MYDSRTDKARTPQSMEAKRAAAVRRDQELDDLYWGRGRLKGRDYPPMPDITALMDEAEPAALVRDCESVDFGFDVDRLHAEALKMHVQWYEDQLDMERDFEMAPWEVELLIGGIPEGTTVAYSSEVWEARMRLEDEDRREREARYDGAFGGYSDDAFEEDGYVVIDCWLPFMRLPELRDTFGENWLGNGFHIVQGNGVRRGA